MERQEPNAQEAKDAKLQKILTLPRKDKRARLRIRHGAIKRPFARVRSGVRTGTTPHFALWMADLSALRALQRIKLDVLADSDATPGNVAQAFALLYVGGVKNVADLSRADVGRLLAIDGIGLKRLEAVEKYMTERHVGLAWTSA